MVNKKKTYPIKTKAKIFQKKLLFCWKNKSIWSLKRKLIVILNETRTIVTSRML